MINIKLTKQVQYLRKKFLSENKTQIQIFKQIEIPEKCKDSVCEKSSRKKKANNYDNISSYDLK